VNEVSEQHDDYAMVILQGVKHFEGHFLEKVEDTKRGITYKVTSHKTTYFYKESIVYPCVNFTESKNVLKNENYIEIIQKIILNKIYFINCKF